MKANFKLHVLFLALLSLSGFAHAQGTALGYQGRLNDGALPATGLYDFTFNVFDVAAAGVPVAGTVALHAVPVTNGLFNASLDFGTAIFTGPARWLEITVRTNGVGVPRILAPRTALLPTAYAIFAGKAAGVVNGTVTANQLNTVGLAPTPGQFLSYNGGNLFWSDPGLAVGDVWSRNGALDAYYTAGKVGIGTTGPFTPLEVNGIVRSTRSGVAPQYIQLNGGDSGSIKLTAQSTLAAEKNLFIQNLSGETTPGANNNIQFDLGTTAASSTKMTIAHNGNVGIGAVNPQGRLHLYEPVGSISHRIETGGGVNAWTRVDFANANGQWNVGTSRDFNGDQLYFQRQGAANIAFAIQPNGDALLQGNLGIGTTTPGARLHAETASAFTAAIYGNATGAGGVGVFGQSATPNGTGVYGVSATGAAVHAEGNATQARDKGGFVKAMLFIEATGDIVRCYNGMTGESFQGPPSSTACGFSVNASGYYYRVDFPFQVSDRFVSVTPGRSGNNSAVTAIISYDAGENRITVETYVEGYPGPAKFTMVVF